LLRRFIIRLVSDRSIAWISARNSESFCNVPSPLFFAQKRVIRCRNKRRKRPRCSPPLPLRLALLDRGLCPRTPERTLYFPTRHSRKNTLQKRAPARRGSGDSHERGSRCLYGPPLNGSLFLQRGDCLRTGAVLVALELLLGGNF